MQIIASQLRIIQDSLRKAGITPPNLDTVTPIPAPQATADELAAAIVNSDYADPYSDPKVQTITTKLTLIKDGYLNQAGGHHETNARADKLRQHAPKIHKQLETSFNKHAAALTQAMPALRALHTLEDVDTANHPEELIHAATIANTAIKHITNILTAKKQLALLEGHRLANNTAKSFMFHSANHKQYQSLRGEHTVWQVAKQDIPLTLALNYAEANQRYNDMRNEQEIADEKNLSQFGRNVKKQQARDQATQNN